MPGLVESEVDGQVSLFHPETQEATLLNQTASDVWRLADGTQTLDQIVELLAQAYGVAPDSIRADVVDTVQSFRDRGLLTEEAQ